MKRSEMLLSSVVLAGSIVWIPTQATAHEALPVEAELVALANVARSQERTCGSVHYPAAAPVTWNAALGDAAAAHSTEMATYGYFGHSSRDGSSPFQRFVAYGYDYREAGENIAAGQATAAEVIASWLGSTVHCQNIMNAAFTEIGVGYTSLAGSPWGNYWTAALGSLSTGVTGVDNPDVPATTPAPNSPTNPPTNTPVPTQTPTAGQSGGNSTQPGGQNNQSSATPSGSPTNPSGSQSNPSGDNPSTSGTDDAAGDSAEQTGDEDDALLTSQSPALTPSVSVAAARKSARLTWAPVAKAVTYQYRYAKGAGRYHAWHATKAPKAKLSGLRRGTVYRLQLRAKVSGKWQPAATMRFRTIR
ncbi:MAG: CAP domain-containing protein [Candidatus Nanopelagicales bacterium]